MRLERIYRHINLHTRVYRFAIESYLLAQEGFIPYSAIRIRF